MNVLNIELELMFHPEVFYNTSFLKNLQELQWSPTVSKVAEEEPAILQNFLELLFFVTLVDATFEIYI